MPAQQAPIVANQQLDQSIGLAGHDSALNLTHRFAANPVRNTFLAQLLLGFTHVRQFRAGVGNPRDRPRIEGLWLRAKSIVSYQAAMIVSNMRELIATCYISRRPNMRHAGA